MEKLKQMSILAANKKVISDFDRNIHLITKIYPRRCGHVIFCIQYDLVSSTILY